MAAPAPAQATKLPKPKKILQASGRGGSGNYRKVSQKSSTTEVSRTSPSTEKKIIEVEIPRNRAAYTGRGGQGNVANHVLNDGVFQRVVTYELGKVQAYREEREAKRRSTARARTYSQAKLPRTSLDVPSTTSIRRSWASKSTVDLTPHSPVLHDARKSLRETLLAPLRTTFTRSSRLPNPKSVRSDSSSFFAGSSTSLTVSSLMSPTSPGSGFNGDLAAAAISPASDETHSAALNTPTNAEILDELAAHGMPGPKRRSTGNHRSPVGGPPRLPSPTTPLPPLPSISINGGRSSLSAPLPPVREAPPPPPMPPLALEHRTRLASMPMKSLRATPAPVVSPMQLPTFNAFSTSPSRAATSSSASSSQDRLTVPDRVGLVGNPYLRAPNRPMYNAAIAARSLGNLPMSMAMDAREASFYGDSDVDRVDPLLAHLGGHEGDKSLVSLIPWLDIPPDSVLSSVSSISIPSFNESQPDLVAG